MCLTHFKRHPEVICDSTGVTAAMDGYGAKLRKAHMTKKNDLEDPFLQALSLWTDNGAATLGLAWKVCVCVCACGCVGVCPHVIVARCVRTGARPQRANADVSGARDWLQRHELVDGQHIGAGPPGRRRPHPRRPRMGHAARLLVVSPQRVQAHVLVCERLGPPGGLLPEWDGGRGRSNGHAPHALPPRSVPRWRDLEGQV